MGYDLKLSMPKSRSRNTAGRGPTQESKAIFLRAPQWVRVRLKKEKTSDLWIEDSNAFKGLKERRGQGSELCFSIYQQTTIPFSLFS